MELKRLKILEQQLLSRTPISAFFDELIDLQINYCSSSDKKIQISIGSVFIEVEEPKHFELVPWGISKNGTGFHEKDQVQEVLKHLRWMMQKANLHQDIFLLGGPGPFRRWLAFRFCELTQREIEYIALSRDTTETDLKQRREIRNRSVVYLNQSAVTAAIEGRVLIIEGIEKCERNVLPVLNNLLENREMTLDDGRLLVSSDRYDHLLKLYGEVQLKQMNLVRVHPNFKVIALGLPVPKFPGNPLDPPLRSRFQARDIPPLSVETYFHLLVTKFQTVAVNVIRNLLTLVESLRTIESGSKDLLPKLPYFPPFGIFSIIHLHSLYPQTELISFLHRVYPFYLVCDDVERNAIQNLFQKQGFVKKGSKYPYKLLAISSHSSQTLPSSTVVYYLSLEFVSLTNSKFSINVHSGSGYSSFSKRIFRDQPQLYEIATPLFIEMSYHHHLLVDMLQDHSIEVDMCVIGPKGCGKSVLIHNFANWLGYQANQVQVIHLYKDMTSRDLLQRRITNENGDTSWGFSPLMNAAISGYLAILDGIHRLHRGTISVIQRLIHDREINLFDGTRLVRMDRYDKMLTKLSFEELKEKKIYPIHPSFRIICSAYLPTVKDPWLTPETMSLFHFHVLPDMTSNQKSTLLKQLFPSISSSSLYLLLQFNAQLDEMKFKLQQTKNASENFLNEIQDLYLSLRQLIRICRHISVYPNDLYSAINRTLLSRFLPLSSRQTLETVLNKIKIVDHSSHLDLSKIPSIIKQNNIIIIDDIQIPISTPKNPSLVPKILFYEVPQHILFLKEMMKDFILGEPLLLIGNQGVGKNKLIDKLLELLCIEREYIQLHRDTTVQTLTAVPSVKGGVLYWEDSPLVRAVREGRALVIDEADKAPLEVVCILKGLIEDKQMLLSDGRKIVSSKESISFDTDPSSVILIHPEFRVIVLANRPGYPFLGNNFYREMGDCFSCHIIDNPDKESEFKILQQYAPDVPEELIRNLSGLFADLRKLVDEGLLVYPYSLRELVHIVRHLQKYGNDSLLIALENVFAFDIYDQQLRRHLKDTFNKHGIPLDFGSSFEVNLATENSLPIPMVTDTWKFNFTNNISCTIQHSPLTPKGTWKWKNLSPIKELKGKTIGRLQKFKELKYSWSVESEAPTLNMTSSCVDNSLFAISIDPVQLHYYSPDHSSYEVIDLSLFLPLYQTDYASVRHPENRPRMSGLPNGNIFVFMPLYQLLIMIDPKDRSISPFEIPKMGSSFSVLKQQIYLTSESRNTLLSNKNPRAQIVEQFSKDGFLSLFRKGDSSFIILDFNSMQNTFIQLPGDMIIQTLFPLSPVHFIILTSNYELKIGVYFESKFVLSPLHTQLETWKYSFLTGKIFEDLLVLKRECDFASFGKFLFETILNESPKEILIQSFLRDSSSQIQNLTSAMSIYLSKTDQLVNVLNKCNGTANQGLEIISFSRNSVRYVILPGSTKPNNVISLVELSSSGDLAVLQEDGTISIYEMNLKEIEIKLNQWKKIVGFSNKEEEEELKITYSNDKNGDKKSLMRSKPKEPTGPKHGKHDPLNEPHVGGNTYEGGTGGTDTAGLGGKGGPYRKDSGNPIVQISEVEKKNVSKLITQEARELAKKTLQQRLKEIDMSEEDSELYDKYLNSVGREISTLRVILEGVEAKAKERVWMIHQSSGDFDDRKIVEGITGERSIYKKRGEQNPEPGTVQELPKRIRFVMDISGSMYRFNGQDKRLERLLQCTLMIMEAFQGFEHKYSVSIVGHSGDSPEIPLVDYGKSPQNRKERLKILKKMIAHSEYCGNGDSTVEAIQMAVQEVVKEPADEYFVFALSDANLRRYGIRPEQLTEAMLSNPQVNTFAIFLASFEDEAEKIQSNLPVGRSFVCLDPTILPSLFKQMFSSLLKDSK